jgi:hypothetical protein
MKRLEKSPSSPFSGKPRLIFHGAHHKMGTVWMMRVLENVSQRFGLNLQKCNRVGDTPENTTHVLFANHSQFDVHQLGDFIGSHMVRDPRDAIVSGYFYHLWTDEAWVHAPQTSLSGLSYQAHLQSLAQPQGLHAEIERFAQYVLDYGLDQWNYSNLRVLEMKYENLIADEETGFAELFSHYGFDDEAIATSLEIAQTFSFTRIAKRKLGKSSEGKHLRSGVPGQWRTVLLEEHCDAIKQRLGNLLIKMGYETNSNWNN